MEVSNKVIGARYWYDGQFLNTSKEDAAEAALSRLSYTTEKIFPVKTVPHVGWKNVKTDVEKGPSTVDSSDGYSEGDSDENGPVASRKSNQSHTLFNPDTGEAYCWTPRTSIHSGDDDSEDQALAKVGDVEASEGISPTERSAQVAIENYEETSRSLPRMLSDEEAPMGVKPRSSLPTKALEEDFERVSFAPIKKSSQKASTTPFGNEVESSSSEDDHDDRFEYESGGTSEDDLEDLWTSGRIEIRDLVCKSPWFLEYPDEDNRLDLRYHPVTAGSDGNA